VPLIKPTLVDNTRSRWRFNPGPCLHSESKTAKSSSRDPDIEHYPKFSLRSLAFLLPPILPLASFYRLNHSVRVENYFTSALARLPRQWVLKIFIFWTRGSSGWAADLKGDRLISLKGDNGSDGTMGFDFEVKRPRRHILSPKSLPAYWLILVMLFRGWEGDLIFWFAPSMQPGAVDFPLMIFRPSEITIDNLYATWNA